MILFKNSVCFVANGIDNETNISYISTETNVQRQAILSYPHHTMPNLFASLSLLPLKPNSLFGKE
jgi:hypothetical protein